VADSYDLNLRVTVARFVTSGAWRAGVRLGGFQIVSTQQHDPVSAVQSLFLKLGSGHENTDLAIESELSGGDLLRLAPHQENSHRED